MAIHTARHKLGRLGDVLRVVDSRGLVQLGGDEERERGSWVRACQRPSGVSFLKPQRVGDIPASMLSAVTW